MIIKGVEGREMGMDTCKSAKPLSAIQKALDGNSFLKEGGCKGKEKRGGKGSVQKRTLGGSSKTKH